MAYIRSRQHLKNTVQLSHTLIALAALAAPLSVQAQQAKPANAQEKTKKEAELPEIKVQGTLDVPFKADTSSSSKFVKPLLETPQMVSVIKKELLQEQGAFNMMDALRNTPGITMQLGENGNTSAGDTFQMRGFATQSSVFVDGVRDLGAVTRDTFNVEQVEVVKGPAGADVGRGAASGYINLASKVPTLEDAVSGTASINNGNNKRITADINQKIGDTTAVRLNVFKQAGGVAGRDQLESNAYGIAPSIAVGLGEKTRAYFYSQHIRQDNVPDGGIPTVGLAGFYNATAAVMVAPKVRSKNYYGSVNDFEKVEADMATAKFEFDLSANTVLRNVTRYGQSSMKRALTGVNGLTATGAQNTWTVARTRQGLDQSNDIFANQTSVNSSFDAAGFKHSLSAGVELLQERQTTNTLAVPTGAVIPAANLYQPDANTVLPALAKNGASSDGQTKTAALYVFDAIDVNDDWQLNTGLRYERYSTESKTVSLSTAAANPTLPVGTLIPAKVNKNDDLLSWKLGTVYKVAKNGRLYGVYATSLTPPGSSNFSLSSAANNVNGPLADPQKTTNLELGTKWDLLNKALAFTAAFYRTDNTNEIVQVDAVTNVFAQFGKRRVEGVELGLVGQVNPDWQITAGVATMKTKVLQGSAGNNAAGAAARWSPDLTATLWSSYKVAPSWTVGGGVRYTSEQKRIVDPSLNAALQNLPSIASSWVANAVIGYQATRNLSLQLNVNNLTDKEYVSTLNNSGARYTVGSPRTISLSANVLF
ncbi:catecholate siderophore receptor Fiu [Undibacterium flavidum]|uniref:Catecholate siderophore receptor Fiu n=1 Tax=Undibacterium flavidum TaxID=2762297 RepID=A0ABR6YH46_9BURK|nr:catecholate siderophore receptor Fiu [Undibacterium flavidum]MBC3875909.1 catecholate siderophore receptor Fiu [Undibacterium flavidum]